MGPHGRGGSNKGKGRSRRRAQPLYAEDCVEDDLLHRVGLPEALQRPEDFARGCEELSGLLAAAHRRCSKRLQRDLEILTIRAVSSCSSNQRDRSAVAKLCLAAKKCFPKQQSAQLEKAYKKLCMSQQRELRRAVSSADEGSAAPIEEVPPEVLEHVLALLPPRDLSSAMCVGRSWRDAAEKPQLWQSFVCRTFASKEQAAFVEMLHSTVRELPPWHAIFSSMAKAFPSAAQQWHHNRVIMGGCRLAWRKPYDPREFHLWKLCEAPSSPLPGLSPTVSQAVRLMLRGSMSPLGTDSSDTSSSEDDDQVDSSTWPGRLWAVPHDAIQRLSL